MIRTVKVMDFRNSTIVQYSSIRGMDESIWLNMISEIKNRLQQDTTPTKAFILKHVKMPRNFIRAHDHVKVVRKPDKADVIVIDPFFLKDIKSNRATLYEYEKNHVIYSYDRDAVQKHLNLTEKIPKFYVFSLNKTQEEHFEQLYEILYGYSGRFMTYDGFYDYLVGDDKMSLKTAYNILTMLNSGMEANDWSTVNIALNMTTSYAYRNNSDFLDMIAIFMQFKARYYHSNHPLMKLLKSVNHARIRRYYKNFYVFNYSSPMHYMVEYFIRTEVVSDYRSFVEKALSKFGASDDRIKYLLSDKDEKMYYKLRRLIAYLDNPMKLNTLRFE